MGRYSRIPVISNPQNNKGAKFYSTVFYPKVPLSENDIYVLTGEGDRLDLLADQFYGDPRLWWVISTANKNLPQNSIHLPVGTQLRIPSNVGEAVDLFNQLNS
tara:strand:- start:2423 stop:2731 length:309 start_codon:yes stop_codon:yes gene_type:complete